MFQSNHPLRFVTCWLLLVVIPLALGNPNGGEIRHGSGEILDLEPGQLTIDQFSDKLIVDWESFSIDHGEVTRFLQPDKNSSALNRVFSGNPSSIHGRLEANGNVWLINPNGVLIGPGGSVKANGFIASSLDVSDEDFLSGGEARFSGGSSAAVQNMGSIEALGGDVFLIAREVSNDGSIKASEGTVGLAAGREVVVAPAGEERIAIAPGGEGSVQNSGTIDAATAELKAAGGNAYALAINNSGMVRAKSFQKRGGRLYLSAGGGRIVNTGGLRASKSAEIKTVGAVQSEGSIRVQDEETGNGGDLVITADQVRILGPADTSGLEGGTVALSATESVHVDGSVKASGTVGNGGKVTLNSPDISLGANADVRADGAAEGGTVLVGLDPRVPSAVGALEAVSVRAAAGSRISANGEVGAGGQVLVFGSQDGEIRLGGGIRANSSSATAGDVLVLGGDVFVNQTADIRVNGETDGGTIQIGGSGDVRVAGRMEAKGSTGDGGFIHVKGENVAVTQTGRIDAGGAVDGGFVHLEGGEEGAVSVAGTVLAKGKDGDGGMIHLQGGQISVSQTGLLDASGGADGGFIHLDGGESVEFSGTARAVGGSGDGGMIQMTGENVTVTQAGVLDASGAVDGGVIHLEGSERVQFDGTALATGGDGAGGRVTITGEEIALGTTALVDATGGTTGGQVLIGGGKQGRVAPVRNARNTSVAKGARLIANGGEQGGEVIVWANGTTNFQGSIEARSGGILPPGEPTPAAGSRRSLGGFAEVSGLEELNFLGEVDTGGGELLLDPFNYTIGFAEAAAIVAALGGGNVTIDTTTDVAGFGSSGNALDAGDITVNSDILWNTANGLTFLGAGNINFNASVQNSNAAGGDLNIVAGWDQTTAFDPAIYGAEDILTTTVYGNGGASVTIGDGTQPFLVVVGSRAGETRVFTHDLLLQGSNGAGFLPGAQLGFVAQDQGAGFEVNGGIDVNATGLVRMLGGSATDAYTQIGHLGPEGFNPMIDGEANGSISISAAEEIFLIPGGTNSGASAQIGNGGRGSTGIFRGAITIEQARDIIFAGSTEADSFTQIGAGGLNTVGSTNSNITISNVRDITINAGFGMNNYSVIGSGGTGADGDHTGTIDITTTRDVLIFGDKVNTDRFGGIGNGDAMGDSDAGRTVTGNINLRVGGDLLVNAAFIGNRVDGDGAQPSGNTFVGVSQADFTPAGPGTLIFDVDTIFSSSPAGELRLYIPNNAAYLGTPGALLNGAAAPAPGTNPLPNEQGGFAFGAGPYAAPFSFYTPPIVLPPAGGNDGDAPDQTQNQLPPSDEDFSGIPIAVEDMMMTEDPVESLNLVLTPVNNPDQDFAFLDISSINQLDEMGDSTDWVAVWTRLHQLESARSQWARARRIPYSDLPEADQELLRGWVETVAQYDAVGRIIEAIAEYADRHRQRNPFLGRAYDSLLGAWQDVLIRLGHVRQLYVQELRSRGLGNPWYFSDLRSRYYYQRGRSENGLIRRNRILGSFPFDHIALWGYRNWHPGRAQRPSAYASEETWLIYRLQPDYILPQLASDEAFMGSGRHYGGYFPGHGGYLETLLARFSGFNQYQVDRGYLRTDETRQIFTSVYSSRDVDPYDDTIHHRFATEDIMTSIEEREAAREEMGGFRLYDPSNRPAEEPLVRTVE